MQAQPSQAPAQWRHSNTHMCSVTPISRSSLTESRGEMMSWPCLSYIKTEKVVSLATEEPPDPEFRFIMRLRDAATKTQTFTIVP